MTVYGFVYVLRNRHMPGLFKIGFTTAHPKARIAQLSRATACPEPFQLIAYVGCENPKAVEGEIHEALSQFRVNDAREFFAVTPELMQDVLRQHADPLFDAFYDKPLDHLIEYGDWDA